MFKQRKTNNWRMRWTTGRRRRAVAGGPHWTPGTRTASRRKITVPRVGGGCGRRRRGLAVVGLVVVVGGGSGVGVLGAHRAREPTLVKCHERQMQCAHCPARRGRRGTQRGEHGLTMVVGFCRGFALVWRPSHAHSKSATSAKPYLEVMYSFQPPLAPADASVCRQTTPTRKYRLEQDGELAALLDVFSHRMNAISASRVSTSKSTTSRRATVPPPRARIPTCSCWSRYVRLASRI